MAGLGKGGASFALGQMMEERESKRLCPAVQARVIPKATRVDIRKGRYHQVRRMFAAVGNTWTGYIRRRLSG